MVDALALGASAARHEGSSPFPPTNLELHCGFRKTVGAVLLSAFINYYGYRFENPHSIGW